VYVLGMGKKMSSIDVKNFAKDASEVMEPNNAKVEVVNIGGQKVMKLVVQLGWKWSNDIKPLAGTDSCQATHLGVVVQGHITCRHDDGTEKTYGEGNAYSIKSGHDAWVIGDTPEIAYEFHGAWQI
jgi:hypothetical protein